MVRQGEKIAILNFGTPLTCCFICGRKLNATVVDMRFVKPIDEARILEVANTHDVIVTLEEKCNSRWCRFCCFRSAKFSWKTTALLQLGLPDTFYSARHTTRSPC